MVSDNLEPLEIESEIDRLSVLVSDELILDVDKTIRLLDDLQSIEELFHSYISHDRDAIDNLKKDKEKIGGFSVGLGMFSLLPFSFMFGLLARNFIEVYDPFYVILSVIVLDIACAIGLGYISSALLNFYLKRNDEKYKVFTRGVIDHKMIDQKIYFAKQELLSYVYLRECIDDALKKGIEKLSTETIVEDMSKAERGVIVFTRDGFSFDINSNPDLKSGDRITLFYRLYVEDEALINSDTVERIYNYRTKSLLKLRMTLIRLGII